MARLKHHTIVPPGGWRYVQPETAARFAADTLTELERQVRAHRDYKGLSVETLAQDIEHQLCAGLDGEWCRPEDGEDHRPVRDLTAELTASMALGLGKAITAFIAGGGELVEKAEAERRAAICRGCPFNKPAKLCACSSVYSLIEAMIPEDRMKPGISVCMACGCSLQAKVNLPTNVILASLHDSLVLPRWCWQRHND